MKLWETRSGNSRDCFMASNQPAIYLVL